MSNLLLGNNYFDVTLSTQKGQSYKIWLSQNDRLFVSKDYQSVKTTEKEKVFVHHVSDKGTDTRYINNSYTSLFKAVHLKPKGVNRNLYRGGTWKYS